MEKTIDLGPVVRPTLKEFENFETYIQGLENKYAKSYGTVKVIPPKGWRARR